MRRFVYSVAILACFAGIGTCAGLLARAPAAATTVPVVVVEQPSPTVPATTAPVAEPVVVVPDTAAPTTTVPITCALTANGTGYCEPASAAPSMPMNTGQGCLQGAYNSCGPPRQPYRPR